MYNNKITFFNSILELYDKENKYNENIADLLLSEYNKEFDIYYELYLRLKEICNIRPYLFIFSNKEKSKIKKFSFKIKDEEKFEFIFNYLKENGLIINANSLSSNCLYKKNDDKKIIFIEFNNINQKIDISLKQ